MRVNTLSLLAALAIMALVAGCGGSRTVGAPQNQNPTGYNGLYTLVVPEGPGMPAASPDDIQLTEDGKIISAAYRKFYGDSVNHHSFGRWNPINVGGQKEWTLSNTFNSAPKAFVFGGNYWNREEDLLFTTPFNVPDMTDGVRLTFTSRWRIAPGDRCDVIYNTPDGPALIATFEGGENPAYPGWTKYYFELPGNLDGLGDDSNTVQFFFTSDTATNDWGFGFDDVAVYQRQLEPLTDLSATDALFTVTLTWSHNDAGTLSPEFYDIYRSETPGSGYVFQESVAYPGSIWGDPTALSGVVYYYVIVSRRTGWPESAFSNEDSGFAIGI
jgi:hypothetical protein